jgi:hypothetical protein
MTVKSDFSEDEWSQILMAPALVGLAVIASDLHMTSMFGETKAMLDAIQNLPVRDAAEELVIAIRTDLLASAQREKKLPGSEEMTPDESEGAWTQLMEKLSAVTALLDAKVQGEEAVALKEWLMSIAEAVAEAGKEGGFLGIGAVRVSDKEKAAMDQIRQALGL